MKNKTIVLLLLIVKFAFISLAMSKSSFARVFEGFEWGVNGLIALQAKSVNVEGRVLCEGSRGKRFFEESSGEATSETIFWIASCTKLAVTVALLQCVEKGLVTLEQDITTILPELRSLELLHGWAEDGTPVLSTPKSLPNLRQILSHQSGIAVDISEPVLMKWNEYQRRTTTSQTGDFDDLLYPMVFEPGQGWSYSVGFDWIGHLISRLNGGITLGQYIERRIFQPLGMKNTTFHPLKDPRFNSRLTGTFFRQPDGSLICKENVGCSYDRSGNDNGGGGLFSNATDYCKLLSGIFLRREGQPVLLGEKLVQEIFKPTLQTDKYFEAKLACMKADIDLDMVPHVPESCSKNFGLGVVLNLEDLDTGLSAGSGQWSGYTNCYWWADLKRGIVGIMITAILNFADPQAVHAYQNFQRVSYETLDSSQ